MIVKAWAVASHGQDAMAISLMQWLVKVKPYSHTGCQTLDWACRELLKCVYKLFGQGYKHLT